MKLIYFSVSPNVIIEIWDYITLSDRCARFNVQTSIFMDTVPSGK